MHTVCVCVQCHSDLLHTADKGGGAVDVLIVVTMDTRVAAVTSGEVFTLNTNTLLLIWSTLHQVSQL